MTTIEDNGLEIEDLMDDEYERERESEMMDCGCKYCYCSQKTEYGEPCYDCENHAHQG